MNRSPDSFRFSPRRFESIVSQNGSKYFRVQILSRTATYVYRTLYIEALSGTQSIMHPAGCVRIMYAPSMLKYFSLMCFVVSVGTLISRTAFILDSSRKRAISRSFRLRSSRSCRAFENGEQEGTRRISI